MNKPAYDSVVEERRIDLKRKLSIMRFSCIVLLTVAVSSNSKQVKPMDRYIHIYCISCQSNQILHFTYSISQKLHFHFNNFLVSREEKRIDKRE